MGSRPRLPAPARVRHGFRNPLRVSHPVRASLAARRAARLLVEELDDRSTPSAVSLGLSNLDLQWVCRQQLVSLRSDICQVRELAAVRPAATLFEPGAAPPRHEAILID